MNSTATRKIKTKPGMAPGKGRTWTNKVNDRTKHHEVKRLDRAFADIPAGGMMLIATPAIIDDYLRKIPRGKSVSMLTLRKDLAHEYDAEYTCPMTAGIFLRIASEAALEQIENGIPLNSVTPFWRAVDPKSPIAKKLTCGVAFIEQQRWKEQL